MALGQLGHPIEAVQFLDALAQRGLNLAGPDFGGKRDPPQKGQVFRRKGWMPTVG
jgi:hypothetical protein